MKKILEADGVYLTFKGREVLTSVYIQCETGRVTGLLGRNGEGKTCLMNIIYGRLPAKSKSVRFNGEPLLNAWKQPERLRFAPQFPFMPGGYSLKRIFTDFNVDFHGFSRGFPGLEHHYHSRIAHLSGGHRRLVEIYVILCSATDFVMLDEPFSHIMPLHVEKLQEVIAQQRRNKGILISDHLYQEIVEASDLLYLLEGGHLKQVGPGELTTLGYLKKDSGRSVGR